MTRSSLYGIALLATIATAAAFVPASTYKKGTELSFKFLKDMGLEKPSWLPNFGGDKKEDAAPAEETKAEAEEKETVAKEE